ncbi:MAG: DCC1-like thiol-disulfide oxidoreductase family protein [Bacteroidota bacterium]
MGANLEISETILFFDGVCNLCNSSVQFVLKRDSSKIFKYASLQSRLAKELLPEHLSDSSEPKSLVLYENQKFYTKSTAALRVAKRLDALWSMFSIFLVIPVFIRDGVYDFIARNRYRWFGKKDQCMIPKPEYRERFLDTEPA